MKVSIELQMVVVGNDKVATPYFWFEDVNYAFPQDLVGASVDYLSPQAHF
jgi:hypothetical protein